METVTNARHTSAARQPSALIISPVAGTSAKCPNEPNAVAMPSAIERRCGSMSLPIAASTTANDAADMPSPITKPPPKYRPAGP